MALTELAIKHLKAKPTVYRVADGGGLCLEVSTAGGKLWRWRYPAYSKSAKLYIQQLKPTLHMVMK